MPESFAASCPKLNFDFKGQGKYYPAGQGSVVEVEKVGQNEYEIVYKFFSDECPSLSNLDQAKIIGVSSPEDSEYILYDSNLGVANIDAACDWAARFVVKGHQQGSQTCISSFQIHYAWFSGRASNSEESGFDYNSAYEYLIGCTSDNNGNAQADFPLYCWDGEAESYSNSLLPTSTTDVISTVTPTETSIAPSSASPSFIQTTVSATASASASAIISSSLSSSTSTTSSTATTTTKAALVEAYGQCGGINHMGATQCVENWTCKSQNPYYYQCVAMPVTTTQTACATMWAQCGGIGFEGYTECCSDATCVTYNSWYAQCTTTSSII